MYGQRRRPKEDRWTSRRSPTGPRTWSRSGAGPESVKQDAEELKGIAGGQGSLTDKAKAAAAAIKEPGAADDASPAPAESAPAAEATDAERDRAGEKVKGEHRGKHSQGDRQGGGRHRGEGRGRGERDGRDSDPAV